MTFKRLLVGTDGSDSALRAVDHAARLAGKLDAELMVMHALPKGKSAPGERTRVTASYDIGTSILRDVAAWFGDRVDVRSLLREGPASDALIAAAIEESVDLLVVGNRGLGTRKLLIGNVPARVAAQAPCSVLIVHTTDSVEEEPYRRLLVATDGSPAARRASEVGGAIAGATGAEVRVVHVGRPEVGERLLQEAARSIPAPALGRTVGGDPGSRLVELAAEEGYDLVVLGGASTSRRLGSGTIAKVVRRAPCHVLLVRAA